jgi:hypothetical protein
VRWSGRLSLNCKYALLGGYPMNEKKPTYRIRIRSSGTPPNETYGWNIHQNSDVLPIRRSQQLFVSRMAGLADANRSRLQLVDADLQDRAAKEA